MILVNGINIMLPLRPIIRYEINLRGHFSQIVYVIKSFIISLYEFDATVIFFFTPRGHFRKIPEITEEFESSFIKLQLSATFPLKLAICNKCEMKFNEKSQRYIYKSIEC